MVRRQSQFLIASLLQQKRESSSAEKQKRKRRQAAAFAAGRPFSTAVVAVKSFHIMRVSRDAFSEIAEVLITHWFYYRVAIFLDQVSAEKNPS